MKSVGQVVGRLQAGWMTDAVKQRCLFQCAQMKTSPNRAGWLTDVLGQRSLTQSVPVRPEDNG